jgi:hypothetical protein
VPEDSRKLVVGFVEDLHKMLDAVCVPLPGGRMSPGRSWRGRRLVPIVSLRGDSYTGLLDMTYTHKGTRKHNGREEAVVGLSGILRGEGFTLVGQAKGKAVIDLATGTVTHAHLTLDLDLDAVDDENSTTNLRGTLDLKLEREVGQ